MNSAESSTLQRPTVATIRTLVSDELEQVDGKIAQQLGSDIELIRELAQHLFGSGGKRLRPLLVLLASRAFGYAGEQHILLAAIVELIHTATLLHDDVVDGSQMRRGKRTANDIWGNSASVLVGDYVYSKAFQMMVKIDNMAVMRILADAANSMAEGEVKQLVKCNDIATTEAQYLEIIRQKTATLFEAAATIAPVLCQCPKYQATMADYGRHLGIAFQMVDDALDYGASKEDIGKNIGDDLKQGKPTLPLIYILKHGDPDQKHFVEQIIKQQISIDTDKICELIASTNAIAYTYALARKQADLALTALEAVPDSPYRQGLQQLAQFAVARTY